MHEFNIPIESRIRYEPKINPEGITISGITPIDKETHWLYEFNEIDDFISALDFKKSDILPHGLNGKHHRLLFRGHRDSEWELLPTRFREINKPENKNSYNSLRSGNGDNVSELHDFKCFIEGMNNLGLYVEDDSFRLINTNTESEHLMLFEEFSTFPSSKQLKELALAQHYGIKTRLLDFTRNHYKALFFAIESIPKNLKNSNKKIGIWIFPERLIEIVSEVLYVERIFVQGFQNKNMAAQEGLFINYFKGRCDSGELFTKEEKMKTLDQYLMLENIYPDQKRLITERIGKPMLYTISQNKLWEIFDMLEALNINWITIQPDLHGIRKEVERRNTIYDKS
ncbi:FRG domain-containing protein [Algibacter miyuki]|uniref:FRG domain-containing protein n=1 Tax=Algibacter miyuki TaxID=1306933 RepID=A0ABV5H3N9_9FLAO|nr:FRG domain-containing protein [Algibacter miyuki]MDN3665599.1 FRG domain-containing protein [Algibacter miyuki]